MCEQTVQISQLPIGVSLTFGNCECWAPLIAKNIQTDTTVRVDVRVIDASGEIDLRWLERIVGGEMDR